MNMKDILEKFSTVSPRKKAVDCWGGAGGGGSLPAERQKDTLFSEMMCYICHVFSKEQ